MNNSFQDKVGWYIRHFKREWQIYVMLAPAIIWFIMFLYQPMYGLQIAFKDYSLFKGITGSPWVGFEHFETLFSSDQFIRAVKNTFIISGLTLLFGFPAPIILALMFNEILNQTFKRSAQTINHCWYRHNGLFAVSRYCQHRARLVWDRTHLLPVESRMVPTYLYRVRHLARGRLLIHRILSRHRWGQPLTL